jgi:hypothetical protein
MDRRLINVAVQMDRMDGETSGRTSGSLVLASVLVMGAVRFAVKEGRYDNGRPLLWFVTFLHGAKPERDSVGR